MSAQTGDQQQVSKGLLITLGVVAAIGVAAALWVFVLQPLTSDESETVAVDDEVEGAEPDDDAEADPAPDADAEEPDDPSGDDGAGDDAENGAEDDAEDDDGAAPAEDDPLESTQVVNARDPFTQLVADTSGGGGSGGAATATGGGESTGDGAASSGDDGGGDDTADVDSTTVTLVDIYTGDDDLQRASIEVDETGYDVLEGETFADNFQLLDIAEECATLLYGDSRFTLCEGDRVRK